MIAAKTDGAYLVSHADGVVSLTFNRPDVRNAIPREAIQPLADLFAEIAQDEDVRVVLVKARGDMFGGGGDVDGMRASLEMLAHERSASYYQRLDVARGMVANWCAIPQPIVTACQGSVAGAAMMYTLGADFTLGEPDTFFLCAHARIGLSPDSGLSYLLPRAIGVKRATELFLSGRRVGAEEALSMGLLGQIVAKDELEGAADKLARSLARGPKQVFRNVKKLVSAGLDNPLETQLALERDTVAESVAHADFEEGVRAFMEKRRADFS